MGRRLRFSLPLLAGFLVTASYALWEAWTMQQLCWSFWISGLCCCLALTGMAALRLALVESHDQAVSHLRANIPALAGFSLRALSLLARATALVAGAALMYAWCWLFGFYGLFLSVFAEMEPHRLFGRNGFINSDFFTPAAYLGRLFWPMILGSLVSELPLLRQTPPWQALVLPFRQQLLPLHLCVLLTPFVSLLAWMLFRDAWQPVVVLLLLALFFFFPRATGDRPAVPYKAS